MIKSAGLGLLLLLGAFLAPATSGLATAHAFPPYITINGPTTLPSGGTVTITGGQRGPGGFAVVKIYHVDEDGNPDGEAVSEASVDVPPTTASPVAWELDIATPNEGTGNAYIIVVEYVSYDIPYENEGDFYGSDAYYATS